MGNPDSTLALDTESYVVASPDQVSSELGGQTILLSMRSAMYYGFEGVGSRIWELVQKPTKVSDVCAVIAAEYEVEPALAESDTLTFFRELVRKGLLEVRSGA